MNKYTNGVLCEVFSAENCYGKKKHLDLFGLMIFKSHSSKYEWVLYTAGLIFLNIQTSEHNKSRQCHEWLL